MAKKKSKAKKKPIHVVVRGKKGYQKMLAILTKYYGHGTKNLYFKDYQELKKEASQLTILFRLEGIKITLKNVREYLPARRVKKKPPQPILPAGWNEPIEYFIAKEQLDAFATWSKDLYIYAPSVLGLDSSGYANTLRCGNIYSYQSTLFEFYKHFNKQNTERSSATDYWIKLHDLRFDSKLNLYRIEWSCCDAGGLDMQSGYNPKGIVPIIIGQANEEAPQVELEPEREKEPVLETEAEITTEPQPQPAITSENLRLKELELNIQEQKTKQAELENIKLDKVLELVKAGFSRDEIMRILGK